MAEMKHKAKNEIAIDKKPRIYFTCHPDDFDNCFEKICSDILKTHDCVIYYTPDMRQSVKEKGTDIGRNNLFVIPVTEKLLTTSNRAMDEDFPFALKSKMTILPILMEKVSDELYSSPENFGDLQYLNSASSDNTEIAYEEKLKKYLDSVLISAETTKRIRAAFDAYIFLSYRKKDRKYANELMRLIHTNPECRDLAIWFDEFLTPGEDFNKNIEKMLDDCELFTLLVTPHIFEKVTDEKGVERDNFVISTELPAAQRKKEEKGTEIFAVEMEDTDKNALSEIKIDACVNARDEVSFRERLLESVSKIAKSENDTDIMHNFLIGLAYLEGIDVEVDRYRAAELITGAAENGLPEAMAKLISMYSVGIGVERSSEQVSYWSQRLSEYYFEAAFSKKNTIKSKEKISQLFELYGDEKYEEVIRQFLLKADKAVSSEVIKELSDIILSEKINEYTLLFEISKEMTIHKSNIQINTLQDILLKSADGTYPPYGPLFWYVPEYSLYKELLFALRMLTENELFTKALALTRDVCRIFGHFNEISKITTELDGKELLSHAVLHGVRKGLCELFFLGHTDTEEGQDIYPRCFNIKEAKSWKDIGCGSHGRMTVPFEDELGLYTHEAYTELHGEYIGIVSVPYDKEMIEEKLNSKSCRKLRGMIFTPTENTVMNDRLDINDKHIREVFVPENVEFLFNDFSESRPFWYNGINIAVVEDGIIYFFNKLFLPEGITKIEKYAFACCSSIEFVNLPESLLKIESSAFYSCSSLSSISLKESIISIGAHAFQKCALTEITLPNSLRSLGDEVFVGCAKLKRIKNCPFGYSLMHLFGFSYEEKHSINCSIKYRKKILQTIDIPFGTTEIYEAQFSCNKELYKVNIPNSVKRINENAFNGCCSLKSIELPDSITEIGHNAFSLCSSLKSIKLPAGITKIGDFAFSGCSSLKSIEFPDSITEIGNGTFSLCSSLKSIKLPAGITKIGDFAFSECGSLKSIKLPVNITEIGISTFFGCCSPKSFEIPNSITEIGIGAFSGCDSLKTIILPKKLKKVCKDSFSNCAVLESISFSDSIKFIEDNAFSGCDSLEAITLPDSIQILGEGVFRGCHKLKRILNCPQNYSHKYLGVSADCDIFYRKASLQDVDIPYGTAEITELQFFGKSEIRQLNIPETVKYIGRRTFEECTSLQTINFSEGISEIDELAFYGCSSLNSIMLPDSVKRIGAYAFRSCEALKSVKLPEGITEIEKAVFRGCSSLASIKLPDSVKIIDEEAFRFCKALKSVKLPEGITEIKWAAFEGCSSLDSITIPDSAERIGESAFHSCEKLKSAKLPEGITEIKKAVFCGCSSLDSITIPDSVKIIGKEAFCSCKALKSVKLPEGITEIEAGVFHGCSSLDLIKIPESVEKIGERAFHSCVALKSVKLPNGITEIEFAVFHGCSSLNSITIPDSVKIIDAMAFDSCEMLKSIKLSESVCKIGYHAFNNCKSLEEIAIPKSVREIGACAFKGCTGLNKITIPIRFEDDIEYIFYDVDLSQVTINWI